MDNYVKMFGSDDLNKAETVTPSTKFNFGDFVFGQLVYDDKVPAFDPSPNPNNTFTASVGHVKDGEIITIAFALMQAPLAALSAMYFDGFYEMKDTGGKAPTGKVITVPRYKTMIINPSFGTFPYAYILKRISVPSPSGEKNGTK